MIEVKKARVAGINHVALEVGDIDEALEFYGKFLKFTLRGNRDTMALFRPQLPYDSIVGQMQIGKSRIVMFHPPAQHLSSIFKYPSLIVGVGRSVEELVWIRFQVKEQGRKPGEMNVFVPVSTDDIGGALFHPQSHWRLLSNRVGAPKIELRMIFLPPPFGSITTAERKQ